MFSTIVSSHSRTIIGNLQSLCILTDTLALIGVVRIFHDVGRHPRSAKHKSCKSTIPVLFLQSGTLHGSVISRGKSTAGLLSPIAIVHIRPVGCPAVPPTVCHGNWSMLYSYGNPVARKTVSSPFEVLTKRLSLPNLIDIITQARNPTCWDFTLSNFKRVVD